MIDLNDVPIQQKVNDESVPAVAEASDQMKDAESE